MQGGVLATRLVACPTGLPMESRVTCLLFAESTTRTRSIALEGLTLPPKIVHPSHCHDIPSLMEADGGVLPSSTAEIFQKRCSR